MVKGKDELSRLAGVAQALALAIARDETTLADEAEAVVKRLQQGRFDVAVVGEFNRGKSTLLNKLLERFVLPSGALPVTSIVTEVTFGQRENANIIFEDGTDKIIDLRELDKYITEEQNPGNRHKIATARVTMPSQILRHGAVLVDTPGVGSIFRHNSELAREMVLKADGAIMVMSADTPITDAERSLIRLLSQRSQRTFFVLNRIDYLEPDDLKRVIWFVENVLEEACEGPQKLYPLSTKKGTGFDAFAKDFDAFLANELDGARIALAVHDITSLSDRIENNISIEESALSMSSAELDERVQEFRRATDWQHDSFADDLVLFKHATNRALSELKTRLGEVSQPTPQMTEKLHESVKDVSRSELEAAIDSSIETQLKEIMEPLRRKQEFEVERAWRNAQDRFERATQKRAEKLREIAGELFDVELNPINASQPASQRGRFFYSAPVHNEPQLTGFRKILQPFTKERRSRERLLAAGDQRFTEALSTHVERLRDDLSQRVADANAALEKALEQQVNDISHGMMVAVERAQDAKNKMETDIKSQRARIARLKEAVRKAKSSTATR